MTRVELNEVLRALPRGDALISKSLASGLAYVSSPNPNFVEPYLREERPIEVGKTSVVLISAPGAVGKSTLATEIAQRTGAPLWDLSRLQVGSRTFAGTIMESYDFQATGVQKRVRAGEFLFVLDALDEAEVRAGSENFKAFLDDLVAAHTEPRSAPTLVILARVDTADWIHLVFEDRQVPFARFEIEFFDRPAAEEFIGKRLDELRKKDRGTAVHRQQPQPFKDAQTRLFEVVFELFSVNTVDAWDDTRVRSFLGYAPVLEALTGYLDVRNYRAFIQELEEGAGAASDPWEFLGDVVRRLLVREKGKVQNAVVGSIGAAAARRGWSDWESLYLPEEQCARVLARSLSVPVSISLGLAPALSTLYEDALSTILPQHPFLAGRSFANVVFREYIYAWGLTRADETTARSLRKTMHSVEHPFLPSQLFSHFTIQIAGPEGAIIEGQDFGAFYESCLSRGQDAALSVLAANGGITATIIIKESENEGENEGLELSVEVFDSGDGLNFWRRLGNADLSVESSIRLGLANQRFVLGPDVDLECRQLVVVSQEIDVDARGAVHLRSENYSEQMPPIKLRVRNQEIGDLAVDWPEIAYPWAPYRRDLSSLGAGLSATVEGETLRKFLMMFRRQRTRKERTLMNARWGTKELPVRDELIEKAFAARVISRVGSHDAVEFNSEFDSLKSLLVDPVQLSPAAAEFANSFLGREEVERLVRRA